MAVDVSDDNMGNADRSEVGVQHVAAVPLTGVLVVVFSPTVKGSRCRSVGIITDGYVFAVSINLVITCRETTRSVRSCVRKPKRYFQRSLQSNLLEIVVIFQRLQIAADDVQAATQGLGTLEQMAEALGTTVSHQSGVSFGSTSAALDPAFIGAIAAAPKGKICGPVKGQIGVYMFQVVDNQAGAYYTEDDIALRVSQEAQYRQQYLSTVMAEEADVKDNRARFY